MNESALALLDFSSTASGIEAADAMVKRAQIDTIKAGTVQPGRYLVLIGGTVRLQRPEARTRPGDKTG